MDSIVYAVYEAIAGDWTRTTALLAFFLGCVWLMKPVSRSKNLRKIKIQKSKWKDIQNDRLVQKSKAMWTGQRYLVIGTGQLGARIVECLVARGENHVSAFDIVRPKRDLGKHVNFILGNVCDLEAVKAACRNIDVVYLTAALIRYYERLDFQARPSYEVNVRGTQNVVDACIHCGVKVLIQTSSSNVVVPKGTTSITVSEESPYVTRTTSPNHYGWTKAAAEKIVLESSGKRVANGSHNLRSASCRPCSGIFGPRDGFILQKFLDDGKIDFIFPDPVIDWVFVDNVVWCHFLIEHGLQLGMDSKNVVSGQVFCASNEDPLSIEDLHAMLRSVHPSPLHFNYLPRNLMLCLAYVIESLQWVSRGRAVTGDARLLTPAMTAIAGASYVTKSQKAKIALGYTPLYTVDEAIVLTSRRWTEGRE